jgi:subtilisin family serine protease
VEELTASTGTLFVVAAGNDGFPGSINSPGSAKSALTVGALTRDGQVASFSSRGPLAWTGWDEELKPEISAPGVDIVAARSPGTSFPPADGPFYTRLSGTSMATPHVAGVAALLAQRFPDWDAGRLKAALVSTPPTTSDIPSTNRAPAGSSRASNPQSVYALTSKLDFGRHGEFRENVPPDSPPPLTKTLTYANTGTDTVTLDLTVQARNPRPVKSSATTC